MARSTEHWSCHGWEFSGLGREGSKASTTQRGYRKMRVSIKRLSHPGQVSTVSGQGQAATWELSPEFSHWLPVLMSPFCCTHCPQGKASHQQLSLRSHTWSSTNRARPCLSIFLSARDLPDEKNPFCNGSGHA